MTDRTIVVVGAAGEMARTGIERFAAHNSDWRLELYDLDERGAEEVAAGLPPGRASAGGLDLFDEEGLRAAVRGASLVILGAGPYKRTGPPVIRACIAEGVDYIDYDDDIESTQDAQRLDSEARDAGVACLIGCGASPGLSNVLAVDAASRLDEVETLDVCWLTGDEGPHAYGAAVLAHVLHLGAGDCLTWRDGREVTVEGFVENDVFPIGGAVGDYRLYETAHPEAVTLPRRFSTARSVRVMGGIHPQPVNGIVRGVSRAVQLGRMTEAEAIEWLQLTLQDENGSLKGWRHALSGMLGQVRRRESSLGAMLGFLWDGVRGKHPEYRVGLLVRATGRRDGEPATITLRMPTGGPGTRLGSSMAAATGTSLAAFAGLALERDLRGVLAPEDWVEPEELYAELGRLGVPSDEVAVTAV